MSFEHFERGYLLPKGCKDLIDAINLEAKPQAMSFLKPASAPPNQLPAIKGDLLVPEHTTVRQLAALLGQEPFKIIADAMEMGLFVTVNQPLGFEAISRIARKYGYTAKRTA
jgi:translation initiation factor IF-2-like protein